MSPATFPILLLLSWLFPWGVFAQGESPDTQDPYSRSPHPPAREVRILLVSQNEVTLSSPLNAPILEIPFRLGDTFGEGERLVRFECARRKGELTKARAEFKIASETLKSHRELRAYDSISELEVAVSEGELQRARGGLAVARARVAKCALRAPFEGTVVREYVAPHEYVKEGEPMLEVIDLTSLEAQIYVPLFWLRRIEMGQTIHIAVDDMDLAVKAEINRMGARVDPESQMVELRARIVDPPPGLMAGMTGTTVISD